MCFNFAMTHLYARATKLPPRNGMTDAQRQCLAAMLMAHCTKRQLSRNLQHEGWADLAGRSVNAMAEKEHDVCKRIDRPEALAVKHVFDNLLDGWVLQ
jgi:hypothetical protein